MPPLTFRKTTSGKIDAIIAMCRYVIVFCIGLHCAMSVFFLTDVLIEIFRFLFHLCLEEKKLALMDKEGAEGGEKTSSQVPFVGSPLQTNLLLISIILF